MKTSKQAKRGSSRTNRQPLGLVSANTPPKNLKLSRNATSRQPLGFVSANTPPKKQQNPSSSNNKDEDSATLTDIYLLPRDIFGRIKFSVVEKEREHVCASASVAVATTAVADFTTPHNIAAAKKNTTTTSIDNKYDYNQHVLSPSSNSSSSGSIAPNSTTTESSMKDNAISEPTFLPPKYFSNANVDVKEKHNDDDDDEPSIGSVSSTATTSSRFSYCGIKRTVSVKPRKKRALVPKFLTSKSKSNKKASREEFVPPEYIIQPPTKELLSKASSTLEYSFVPSKCNATSTAANLHQKLADDKTSINSIASISHRGIKYTLSLNDLIDCYDNYLVGKQTVVRSDHRSRTIHGKRMPRVLRLRLKRCTLDIDDVYRYKALKLCQRIIFRRIKVHNGNCRKSIIQSISKKINIADPIRESSKEVNQSSVEYNTSQDIQRIMLQRKKTHNEICHKSIRSIREMINADITPFLSIPSRVTSLVAHQSIDFTSGAYDVIVPKTTQRINSIAHSALSFTHWLILFLLQDFAVLLCLGLAYILRLLAENAEKLATFLKSTKSTVQVVENGNGSTKSTAVQYVEPTRALLH